MTSRSLLRSCLALVAALAASASTARADEPSSPLSVRVRGADADAIARAIAAELGVTTAITTAAACPAPCVDVEVATGGHATIAVIADGALRTRAIDLPAGPAAAEIVALVVGNLARDEAGALLASLAHRDDTAEADAAETAVADELAREDDVAETVAADEAAIEADAADTAAADDAAPNDAARAVPMPTPAAAPTPTPTARPRRAATRYGLGLLPFITLDIERRDGHGGVTIDLLIGGRRRVASFNVAGVGSIVTEDLRGTQIGGAVTHAGAVYGTQIAGAVATARTVRGTQLGGAITAAGDVKGAQIAGAVAISGGDVRGTQIAGAVSVAGGAVDTQVSGAVSVAGRVRGLQLAGAVNVADRVDGVQVGVVNVAGGGDGVSIGLINLVRGGRTEVEATVDQDALGAVVLRHGSRRWHNVYGVGGKLEAGLADSTVDDRDVWMYGLGMGPSWRRGGTTIDLEAMGWHVVYGGDFDSELDLLGQLRVVVGVPLGPVTLVGGAAANAYITTDATRTRIDARPTPMTDTSDDVHVRLWPTAFVGVRL